MAGLTKEQEKYLIDSIVEYVDKYSTLPGNKQIFRYKNAEFATLKITQEQITDFYRGESCKNVRSIKGKFKEERQFGFGKDGKKDEKVFLEWAELAQKYHKDEWNLGDELLERYHNGDFGFKTFARFYKWYESQPKECYYCGATQEQLNDLFKKNDTDESEWDKTLYSKKTGFTAELQVEKLNPNKPYNESNCKLACAFCNNAKSDMVNDKNFEKYFAKAIKYFLKDMCEKDRKENEMPFFEANDSSQYQK